MKDIVKAMLLRGTNVLLARRSSGRRNYPDRWSFPGGLLKPAKHWMMRSCANCEKRSS
jgi:ADP-ribose pyrophosphatase YjhB (NUDIX family)